MSNERKLVKVHYIGTLDNGEEFDNSFKRGEPIQFICMGGQMIPGFDLAVRDMELGDTIDIHLEPSEAYGERDELNIVSIPTMYVPNADLLPVGQEIIVNDQTGPKSAVVLAVDEDFAVFDMNHPMAGKALNFKITLIDVEEVPVKEIEQKRSKGRPRPMPSDEPSCCC